MDTSSYPRYTVSSRDQNPDAQHDALAAAGCDQIFVDKPSGKLARRPELDKVLMVARTGDQLVVTKLDRLGRSLEHLIGLTKELQARSVDLIVLEQGIDTTSPGGRLVFHIMAAMYEELDASGKRKYTVEQIAEEFGVTRPTIYRHLSRLTAAPAS